MSGEPDPDDAGRDGSVAGLLACAVIFVAASAIFIGVNLELHLHELTDVIGWSLFDTLAGIAFGALAAVSYLAFRDRGRLVRETRRRRLAEAAMAANEQRFRDYAEVSSDWFWELDRDLRFSFLSAGTDQRTGEDPNAMIGQRPTRQGLADVTDEAWEAHMADLTSRRPVVDFRFARIDSAGTLRHFRVSAKPVYDSAGEFAGYRGTGRDVTRLTEARRFLRQVIDATPALIAVRDTQSRYLLVNNAFARLCGVTPEDLVGKPAGAYFGSEAGTRVRARDREVLETGTTTEPQEIRLRGKGDGIERIWLNQLVPLRNAIGEIAAIVSIGADVSTLKEAETGLLWAQERLRESEGRFRDFAETASDWFWEQDENLRFTFISSGNMRLSNMSAQAHYGKTRRETNPLDVSVEQWARHDADLAARRPFTDFRFSRLDPDGRKRYLTLSGKPVFDKEGRFKGYRGTGRDLTALVEAEQRFRDFAEAGAHVIWEMDKDLRITFISDSVEEVTGDPPSAYIGRKASEFAAMDATRAPVLAALEVHQPFRDLPFTRPHRDGRALHLMFSAKPVLGANGEFLGYRGTTRDVTAQREAEFEAARLRQARDLAAAADLAKSRFLAHMSHELRTPLNAILGFSELMLSEAFGPLGADNYRGYLRDIRDSGQHLLGIISDLLDKSRVELGQFELSEEDVEIAAVADEAVRIAQGANKDDGPSIVLEPVDGRWVVRADRRVLRQILVNLLSNASKFTPCEGRVSVSMHAADGGAIMLQVADTGCGIEPERMARIFEPFQHQHATHARKGKGAGLGLWLSRSLAELHGGTLALASLPGEGTVAKFTLPAARIVGRPPAGEAWALKDRRRLAG